MSAAEVRLKVAIEPRRERPIDGPRGSEPRSTYPHRLRTRGPSI
jgi:hypothetical protein